MKWSEQVDVISSDESSPSDSEIEVCGSHPGKQLSTNNVVDQSLQDMTSEGIFAHLTLRVGTMFY